MNKVFRKISAVIMVAILLLSTTSFSVYKHFCGDNLVTISTEEIDSCCTSEEDPLKTNNLNFSEKNCCKNETSSSDIQIFDTTNPVKISKNQVLFLTSFYYNFIEKPTYLNTANKYYKDFSPQKLVANKQVLFQTFLI
ncbi:hypothetical protein MHL31_16075 [Lutibacter sp. A80]|uniref:HYC_CC_PP family protein n=1 Tax=Lutibacter sp. A80 TaxID=2918453 RepID=UPI001F06D218|nr:hypothetical protein [Lutibacter sp. A80]UMB60581.1 hypothetical protein MHL31_16075 [Lutibacter sp. A80]